MSKIEQPSHYQGRGGITANDVIRAFELNFALGNVIKYVLRAGRKSGEPAHDDLRKALWYLHDEFAQQSEKSDLEGLAARETAGEWGAVALPRADFIKSLTGASHDD